ncbi:MAG: hypothetical protein RIR41_1805 [Pseudomonadota bacterium]|jgi:hypothetical protein
MAARCVAVANGKYSGYAVKVNGRWPLNRLDLTPIIFNPVFQSGAGCKQCANACGRAVMARPMPQALTSGDQAHHHRRSGRGRQGHLLL